MNTEHINILEHYQIPSDDILIILMESEGTILLAKVHLSTLKLSSIETYRGNKEGAGVYEAIYDPEGTVKITYSNNEDHIDITNFGREQLFEHELIYGSDSVKLPSWCKKIISFSKESYRNDIECLTNTIFEFIDEDGTRYLGYAQHGQTEVSY